MKGYVMKENESKAVVYIRNRQEVSVLKTVRGFDVTIKGRWQGQDSEIFLSLKYIGRGDLIALIAEDGSFMSGFRTLEPDHHNSLLFRLVIRERQKDVWEVRSHKAVTYTRAQRKLVPQIVESIIPLLDLSVEDQKVVTDIESGFQVAREALRYLRLSKELHSEYLRKFEEAASLLNLDKMGIETLVALGEEGADIHVLAKNMDALLK
jgi:hypothetical protein